MCVCSAYRVPCYNQGFQHVVHVILPNDRQQVKESRMENRRIETASL
jgi:hypothetical protein